MMRSITVWVKNDGLDSASAVLDHIFRRRFWFDLVLNGWFDLTPSRSLVR